jgi:hypothetical protein
MPRGILKRCTASVSLIYARLELAASAIAFENCLTIIVSNGRRFSRMTAKHRYKDNCAL